MATDEQINAHLQQQLRALGLNEAPATLVARWLDDAGLLRDSPSRPGLPLRNRLRDGRVAAAEQRPAGPHGKWFIGRLPSLAATADPPPGVASAVLAEFAALARGRDLDGTERAWRDGNWLLWPTGRPGCR